MPCDKGFEVFEGPCDKGPERWKINPVFYFSQYYVDSL
jgi:hypothetical protein